MSTYLTESLSLFPNWLDLQILEINLLNEGTIVVPTEYYILSSIKNSIALTVLPSIPKNALILLVVSRAALNKNGVPFDTTTSISLLESNL